METGAIEKAFGLVVRKLREDKELSQEAFADLAGIDRSYQGRIERGEVSVTLRMIEIMSKTLDVKASELLLMLEKLKF